MVLRVTHGLVPFALLLLGNAGDEKPVIPISPRYVAMTPLTVPIVECDRMSGAMTIKVIIDAGTPEAAGKLTADMPRLRETTLLAAMEFARLHASAQRPIDAERLDSDLSHALVKEKPAGAKVLLTRVSAQSF